MGRLREEFSSLLYEPPKPIANVIKNYTHSFRPSSSVPAKEKQEKENWKDENEIKEH